MRSPHFRCLFSKIGDKCCILKNFKWPIECLDGPYPRIIYVSVLARVCVSMFECLDIALVLQKYTCNNISDEKMN